MAKKKDEIEVEVTEGGEEVEETPAPRVTLARVVPEAKTEEEEVPISSGQGGSFRIRGGKRVRA